MRLLSSAATGAAVVSSILAGSFLNPVVTGGTTATAGTEYPAIAAAFVLLAAFFGVLRLAMMDYYRLGDSLDAVPTVPQGVKVMGKRIGSLALAGMLVTTAATAPVAAQSSTVTIEYEHCGVNDLIFQAFSKLTGGDEPACLQGGISYDDYANISATDGYAASLSVKDSVDSYSTTTQNRLQDTRTIAYSKAKISIINDLNNDTALTQAKNNANISAADYYAQVEANTLRDWNAKMAEMKYINGSEATVYHYEPGDTQQEWQPLGEWGDIPEGFYEYPYTLTNGSTINVTVFMQGHYENEDPNDGTIDEIVLVAPLPDSELDAVADYIATLHPTDSGYGYSQYTGPADGIGIKDPVSTNNTVIIQNQDYRDILNEIYNQKQQVTNNMGPVADGYYSTYNAGDIDSTDLARMDPSVIANEAGTEFNSTGYYSYAAMQLAAIGYKGNLNNSHTLTVHNANGSDTIVNGTLFYTGDDAPAGWDTGTRYNFSDYNGTFYFAFQETNSSGIYDLSDYGDGFTITEATNVKTGETVNTTSAHQYVYEDTNATALQDQIDELTQLRQELEDAISRTSTTSGGTSGVSFDLKTEDKAIVVAALVVVALLLTRN
ncbi:hypothetical protein [Haloferax sp. YSMS24]|uniref:hypothetical protein n=1 Tax=Haloferax sp. YSMS24 TaxID=3388425 RepID=UPI00398D2D86